MEFKYINIEYIEEICDKSKALIADMITIFREQVSEFAGEMKRLLREKEYYELGLLAHKAKSSVAIMGMKNLAEKLKELELNAKEGIKTEDYPALIEDFIKQTNEAVKELDKYLISL